MLALRFLGLDLPFGEFWLPVIAGLVVGLMALGFVQVFGRRAVVTVPPPPPKQTPQYDPFVQGSATEQRRSLRRGGNPVEVTITGYQGELHGWVVDRSTGGLCVSMHAEVPPGIHLKVLPTNASTIVPSVEVEVRSCRRVKDGFEVGCQFIKQPTWAVLLLFG